MIAIDNTLISEDLLDKKFVCDLNACKGACCVIGESGAPLEKEELPIIESVLEKVKPYMNEKGKKTVAKFGTYVIDHEGDYTTPLVSEGAECAFVYFDETNTAKCVFEKAYMDGVIDWKKPVSCHLYPVRITKYKNYDAVNYHKWNLCKPACDCGKKLDVPVYRFLKEPLMRHYGEAWYKELEKAAKLAEKPKK
ncbi:MAG: DUF3109 family protein [Bacteroidia bacterium]|nr:DUF3109 family protein [Bacteroidia bacterium]